jgi:hypothetical protein
MTLYANCAAPTLHVSAGVGDTVNTDVLTSNAASSIIGACHRALKRHSSRSGFPPQKKRRSNAYVLERMLSIPAARFQQCMVAVAGPKPSFGLAELNSLLTGALANELRAAVAAAPEISLSPYIANYVAAMVELACERRAIAIPHWTKLVTPLKEPAFGSQLPSLRHYLLTQSPAAFRRRNIFIDSTLGSRV